MNHAEILRAEAVDFERRGFNSASDRFCNAADELDRLTTENAAMLEWIRKKGRDCDGLFEKIYCSECLEYEPNHEPNCQRGKWLKGKTQ